MVKTAVQQIMIGKVSKNEKQIIQTLNSIKDSGYTGIELCSFMIHKTPLLVRFLTKMAGMPSGNGGKYDWHSLIKQSNLIVTSIHTDLGSLERDYMSCVNEAKSFNCNYLVITGMYRFDYSSEENIRDLTKRLNETGKKLKEEGINLLYHNHNCELLKVNDSMTAYDLLINETNPDYVNFEFDSYWFTEAGASAITYMKKLGKRMKMWHINDRGSRINGTIVTPILKSDSMELGYGNMMLDDMYDIAMENKVEAIILESHKNHIDNDPIKSLKISSEYLKRKNI